MLRTGLGGPQASIRTNRFKDDRRGEPETSRPSEGFAPKYMEGDTNTTRLRKFFLGMKKKIIHPSEDF
jgi:hypothetical protein